MALHLIKLCVGAESVEDMRAWSRQRAAENAKGPHGKANVHVTRMFPKAAQDVLAGGSLYWVIKGIVLIRQRVIDLKPVRDKDGIERCAIVLDPKIVDTEAQPRRAFQGWRYLKPDDAPPDLKKGASRRAPPELRAKLALLGLM
jgi:hypothetical protein